MDFLKEFWNSFWSGLLNGLPGGKDLAEFLLDLLRIALIGVITFYAMRTLRRWGRGYSAGRAPAKYHYADWQ